MYPIWPQNKRGIEALKANSDIGNGKAKFRKLHKIKWLPDLLYFGTFFIHKDLTHGNTIKIAQFLQRKTLQAEKLISI